MDKIWNSHGHSVVEAATSKEAMQLASLDYTVRKDKVAIILPKDCEKSAKYIPNTFGTYRTDTLDVFGVVSANYEIIQNTKAFEFMDSIVGKDKAIFETAGAISNGKTTFITAKLPYHIRINGHDTIEQYLVISNGHDGKTGLNIFLTPVRIVCQNALALGKANSKFSIKLRHTIGISDKLNDAKQILNISSTLNNELSEALTYLTRIKITDEVLGDYVNELLLTPNEIKELIHKDIKYTSSSIISSRKKNIITSIHNYYHTGVGQSNITGTAYGAYNAINGYLSNSKSYMNADKKLEGLMMGGAEHKLNNKALDLALQLTT